MNHTFENTLTISRTEEGFFTFFPRIVITGTVFLKLIEFLDYPNVGYTDILALEFIIEEYRRGEVYPIGFFERAGKIVPVETAAEATVISSTGKFYFGTEDEEIVCTLKATHTHLYIAKAVDND